MTFPITRNISENVDVLGLVQADHLSGFHANTHIPVIVGSQMRYEATGDPIYRVCY